MNTKSKLVYLIGKPGTGKYTIAQNIAKNGYIIFDNQLVNNPIFTLLNYDGFSKIPEAAWDAIGKIRNIIFDFIALENSKNYVLTNVLEENEGDRSCYIQVEKLAEKNGFLFFPVKLLISKEENSKRIQNPERIKRYKSIDPQDAYFDTPLLNFNHRNLLTLDVTNLSAENASLKILKYIEQLEII